MYIYIFLHLRQILTHDSNVVVDNSARDATIFCIAFCHLVPKVQSNVLNEVAAE